MKCEICEENLAILRCPICNRNICENCFDKENNLCLICKELLCYICRKRLSISVCAICGKPICRIDSVRFGLMRICKNCLNTYKQI